MALRIFQMQNAIPKAIYATGILNGIILNTCYQINLNQVSVKLKDL